MNIVPKQNEVFKINNWGDLRLLIALISSKTHPMSLREAQEFIKKFRAEQQKGAHI